MANTVRAYLKDALDAVVPASWVIIAEQRFPATISAPTVVIQHTRIERLQAAPLGSFRNEVVVSVLDPHSDLATAEDSLDDHVVEVLTALVTDSDVQFLDAEKTMHNESIPAWNLRLYVNTYPEE